MPGKVPENLYDYAAVKNLVLAKSNALYAQFSAQIEALVNKVIAILDSYAITWQIAGVWAAGSVLVLAPTIWAILYFVRIHRYKTSWYYKMFLLLTALEKKLETDTQATINELSKLLRILAIKRFSRDRCSTLTGYEWLEWLTEHDPNKFSWTEHGKILLVDTKELTPNFQLDAPSTTGTLDSIEVDVSVESHGLETKGTNTDVIKLIYAAKSWATIN